MWRRLVLPSDNQTSDVKVPKWSTVPDPHLGFQTVLTGRGYADGEIRFATEDLESVGVERRSFGARDPDRRARVGGHANPPDGCHVSLYDFSSARS